MKVLFLTPSVRPLGARRSLVELIRALPPSIEPFVACPSEDGIALELKDLGVPVGIAPQGAWRKLSGRFTALFRQLPALRRIASHFRPNLIHANEFHIVPQAFSLAQRKYPLVGHVRLGITPRQIRTYHMQACTRVVAVSSAVKSLFSGTDILERVRVVHNGVDVAALSPDGSKLWEPPPSGETVGKRTESAATGGFMGKPLIVGLFGLVSERKNQLLAAEAVALANRQGANIHLLLAGDAFGSSLPYGDRLRQRLAAPDLAGRAHWLPFQKDIAALYRSIDLNLLISSEEGFGRTIIEAAACKRPSLGSRIGGIPELIREGETGWLVEGGNTGELANRLVELARSPDALHRAGNAAHALTHQQFTIQAHVAQMIAIWEEALADGPR